MELTGKHTFKAPIQKVWAVLLSKDAIKASIPGCEKYDEIEPEVYDVLLKLGVASIKGTYNGRISVADKTEPSHYRLLVEGSNANGFLKGEGIFDMTAKGTDDKPETELVYVGKADVGGQLAGIGTRMLLPVAKMLAGQFFKNMEKQIALLDAPAEPATTEAAT